MPSPAPQAELCPDANARIEPPLRASICIPTRNRAQLLRVTLLSHHPGPGGGPSMTCGFGPLTLFHRRVVPHRLGAALERGCRWLADRGVPGIRSAGWHYMVLARKERP